MFSEIFLDVKEFFTIIAFQGWRSMINHVCLEISQGIEDFSTFVARNFLLCTYGNKS